MAILPFAVCLVLGYLLGSIPTAVWLGKLRFKIDVREHGSGNAGATNTFRVLGKKAGLLVLAIDLFKGLMATQLFHLATGTPVDALTFRLLLGMAAVIGHVFPLWVGFRGGKGVATIFGALIGIHWHVTLIMLVVFFLVMALTRYVSLASMLASLVFPVALFWLEGYGDSSRTMAAIFLALFILYTHRSNIQRLLEGEENKFSLSQRNR